MCKTLVFYKLPNLILIVLNRLFIPDISCKHSYSVFVSIIILLITCIADCMVKLFNQLLNLIWDLFLVYHNFIQVLNLVDFTATEIKFKWVDLGDMWRELFNDSESLYHL